MTNLPERRDLRISDADRDDAAAILREAAGEGRLDLAELDERLSLVYAAKTYGDLEPVTRDLPRTAAGRRPTPATGARAPRLAIGILGGFRRRGAWTPPDDMTAVAFWGGGTLDLREARFAGQQVTIRAFAIMGGVEVIVPTDAEVHVNGVGIMGGFDQHAAGAGTPGAPRIVVTGFAFWGGVDVKRKPAAEERKRAKLERERLDE
jgi:hypothetical protein